MSCVSYETYKPTAKIIKDLFIPEFPNVNFKNTDVEFEHILDDSYMFVMSHNNTKINITLHSELFIWNRYP